jgi:ATP-dependent RNA helicase DeaD
VGYQHGVKPGNIVGAIANEGGIDSKHIGRIEIYDDYSVLDMPDNLTGDVLDHLAGIKVAGQQLRISRDSGDGAPAASAPAAPSAPARPAPAKAAAPAAPAKSPAADKPADKPAGSPLARAARVDAAELDDAAPKKKKEKPGKVTLPMSAFRIEVGSNNAATPSNIVGAIANEAGLEAKHIGRIEIFDTYSMVELPDGMPDELFKHLGKVWVGGAQLKISHADRMPPESGKSTPPKKKPAGKKY